MPLERIYERYGDFARYSAEHSTEMEIKAMSAERECEDCYKAEYMASRLGQIFEGVVSGAAAYGIYVELPNTVEGLVRIEALPEGNYVYDGLMQLMDPVSGRRYRIGDAVRIFVSSVDVASGMVDFGMVDENGNQIPMKERGSVQVTVEGREERGAGRSEPVPDNPGAVAADVPPGMEPAGKIFPQSVLPAAQIFQRAQRKVWRAQRFPGQRPGRPWRHGAVTVKLLKNEKASSKACGHLAAAEGDALC